jgi:hypothetical protein
VRVLHQRHVQHSTERSFVHGLDCLRAGDLCDQRALINDRPGVRSVRERPVFERQQSIELLAGRDLRGWHRANGGGDIDLALCMHRL